MGRPLVRAFRLALTLALFTLAALALLAGAPGRAVAAGPNDGLKPAPPTLDRSTPRRALEGFIRAGDSGKFDEAMQYLDLRTLPKARQAKDGPGVAEKLWYVLTHTAQFDLSKVPDDPTLVPPKNATSISVGNLYLGEEPVPLAMSRELDDGSERWVIARATTALATELYASMGRFTWEDRIPEQLRVTVGGNALWQWLGLLAGILLAYLVARVVAWALAAVLRIFARRTHIKADELLIQRARGPARLLLTVLILNLSTDVLRLTEEVDVVLDHVVLTLLVVGCGWLAFVIVGATVQWLDQRMPDASDSDLSIRGTRTRLLMFERISGVLIVLVASALVLMQFAVVRSVGISLLASAGLAGVVLGFAAQKSLGTIVAGLQLSITQPIRLGDSVVIEGEFGTIEEILLTYVLVKLWDERRLVVPVTRFLEHPFQNWSKVTAQLTGAVTLTCDFATPVAQVREELQRICSTSKLWDGRTSSLQVTEASERSITLRALVSASSAGAAGDLRCEVREKLVAFLCALEGGKYLPHGREEQLGAAPVS